MTLVFKLNDSNHNEKLSRMILDGTLGNGSKVSLSLKLGGKRRKLRKGRLDIWYATCDCCRGMAEYKFRTNSGIERQLSVY